MTKFSWTDIERLVDEMADHIVASGFKPDCLIGIATGGLVPLALLSKKLGIREVLAISASSYEKDSRKELRIGSLPAADLIGKKALLIDEIADTGTTLEKVADIIRKEYQVKELKTATLAVNETRCKFRPDFFVYSETGEWVVFPWERAEFPEHFLDDTKPE